jgi:hypothetical protein
MNNYRPISLLCTFSKILEKIVSLRLTKYLNENNLLSSCQFGFRQFGVNLLNKVIIINTMQPGTAEPAATCTASGPAHNPAPSFGPAPSPFIYCMLSSLLISLFAWAEK